MAGYGVFNTTCKKINSKEKNKNSQSGLEI
jgi:hypothetical protein